MTISARFSHHFALSQPTVRRYLRMYQDGGLERLKELNFYRPVSVIVRN